MAKRDFATNPDIDIDAPRPKRHKDVSAEPAITNTGDAPERGASSDREDDNADANVEADPGNMLSPEEVREEGSKVLQLLKDAVDKEGRIISTPFMRLPSKRQFPDYYEIIKRPIALDDIKTQLDKHAYPSLEAVRQDIETCFKNAKKYNVRESDIWKHAKTLHKLANKEVDKILRKGDEEEEGSDKESGKKKEKGVNIHRLMKNRLQKLVSLTDETGRSLSVVFMDLPSKRQWAIYYKIIKRPICIEDIFKRIKRKEYSTIPDFMNDVELVFTNAMQFNEENSAIWVDAATLREYFHQIMYDLPAKYNMSGIEADPSISPEASHPKIKLKLPNHSVVAQSGSSADGAQNGEASNASVRLRVPGLGASTSGGSAANSDKPAGGASTKKAKANSPAVPALSLPSTASIPYSTNATSPPTTALATASTPAPALAMPTPKPARVTALPTNVKTTLSAQPITQQQTPYTPFHQYTTPNHIPAQSFYNPPAPASSQTPARGSATPAPALPTPAATAARADAPSPVPPASAAGLYSVRLESCLSGSIQARRRLALLNARAGVRNFSVHVPLSESKVVVRAVKFTSHDDDGDVSDVDVEEPKMTSAQIPVKRRGRGRPKKAQNLTSNQEAQPPASDVQTDVEMSSPLALPTTSPNGKKKEKDKPEWQVPLPKDVLVKLDGQEVTPKKMADSSPTPVINGGTSGDIEMQSSRPNHSARSDDEWAVDVTAGQHILEVGKKGNSVHWRVFLCVS